MADRAPDFLLYLLLQTLAECHISTQGEAIVEPIMVHFVFKKEGTEDEWEEVCRPFPANNCSAGHLVYASSH